MGSAPAMARGLEHNLQRNLAMKVHIGPHKSWIGPYQIAEALCFWVKPVADQGGFGISNKPDWVHDFGRWLSENKHGKKSVLTRFCEYIHSKRNRKVKVKIHKYDTWSMDSTLAHIVLPMLKQLKATKHGAPFVDDADVPDNLKSSAAPPKDNEWDTDANHFLRWDWVLDQMIVAFESKNSDWEDEYRSGTHDTSFVASAWDKNGKATSFEMQTGPNNTYTCDYEALAEHQKRITNGFRLFGKYYEALWD